MNDDTSALARRWFDAVWNTRSEETIREMLDPRAVGHLEGLVTNGLDEFLAARSYLLNAFPDFRINVDAAIAQGDDVAVRWTVNGTHRGQLLDVPATNQPVTLRGMTWLRFSNGRIIEGWDAWNRERLMCELRAAAGGGQRPS